MGMAQAFRCPTPHVFLCWYFATRDASAVHCGRGHMPRMPGYATCRGAAAPRRRGALPTWFHGARGWRRKTPHA